MFNKIYRHILISFICFLFWSLRCHTQERDSLTIDSIKKENLKSLNLLEKGKYGDAIEISNKVLKYAVTHNDDLMKSSSYGILGNAYFNTGNDSLGFSHLLKAMDIRLKLKDTANIVISYNDLAIRYSSYDDSLAKSNLYFEKALEFGRKLKNNDILIYPLNNIGDNFLIEEKYEEAIRYFEEAKEIAENSKDYGDRSVTCFIYRNLYITYYMLGNQQAYEENFQKGIAFAKEHKYFQELADFYSEQADLLAGDKKFEKAFYALDEYTTIIDTVYTIKEFEKAKQIEADNFLRENKERLTLAQKEQEAQEAMLQNSRVSNIVMVLFSILLLVSIFYVFKKNKLFKAEKEKAERLSKAKSDFYSEISHELRTPLYAVIELSGLLLKENKNKKHQVYLESLNFSGSHLLSLVNNVLELNKVESGKMKIEAKNFDLKVLLSNIIESVEFALNDSNNTLHLNHDPIIPDILIGDSLKLSQIFINLISNAIKFTNDGNIYVTTKMVEDLEEEVKIFFEVRDDGPGIPEEKQAQVFEDFYQEVTKADKSYKGTGLGLSIVKRFVTAMNSKVVIESNENEGAAFSFELILRKPNKMKVKAKKEKDNVYGISGKHILAVDDNKVNQLVTKQLLLQLGTLPTMLGSGEEAVEAAIDTNFDCILMDINMPGLNGYETTELIRKFNKDVPIIALTASSTEEVKANIEKYGMDGYVIKPFLKQDFLVAIHTAIHKKETTSL